MKRGLLVSRRTMELKRKLDARNGTGYERTSPPSEAYVLMFAEAHSKGAGGATTVAWMSCG